MMRTALLAGIVLASTLAASPGSAQDRGWRQYSDAFSTRVALPSGLFSRADGPAEQGDGQRFRTGDGRAQITIYSLPKRAGEKPGQYLRNHLKVSRSTVEYQRVTPRFYVLSSVKDGHIYYSRCNFARRIHCVFMTYPEAEKRAWDAIVSRVSLSLRPLTG